MNMLPAWLTPFRMVAGAAVLVIAAIALFGSNSPSGGRDTDVSSLTREGLRIDFEIKSAVRPDEPLMAGEIATLKLKFTDTNTGRPVSGLLPAAWIDPLRSADDLNQQSCRKSAGTYLSGYLGIRPMIDLNSYYLVVLNADPTIAVIDPIIGVRGITKLLTQIILPGRGEDWARSADQKKVFVAMPGVDAVSVIDLDTFRLADTIRVGEKPTRIAVQPDGRYAWVGTVGAESGVTIIDARTSKVAAHIPTGNGHHELLITGDNRWAFVSNREDRTISIIDARTLKRAAEIKLAGTPISMAYSELAKAVYVADGQTGEITVIDAATAKVRGAITLEPGLGPMRMAGDGRFGLITNPSKNAVFVFDTANNRVAHRLSVDGEPFQLSVSRNYAFVRGLSTTHVTMIRLADLGGRDDVTLSGFEAGERPPADSPHLLPTELFATAVTEAATLVVSPGDATVYYYMEGMNAPMGSFGNYGHRPLSALIADRTIKEASPGEYVSTVKIPAEGDYQLILTMDTPQLIDCFAFAAAVNPALARDEAPLRIAYETRSGVVVETGAEAIVRFSLSDSAKNGAPYEGSDVRAMTFRAPGQDREEHTVTDLKNGHFEVRFTPHEPGAYYVYPAVPGLGMNYAQLPFLTLIARDAVATEAPS